LTTIYPTHLLGGPVRTGPAQVCHRRGWLTSANPWTRHIVRPTGPVITLMG